MNIWWLILIIGIVAFSQRIIFIGLEGRWAMPPLMRRGLRYVPAAVLPALVAPAVLLPEGTLELSPIQNGRIIAALVGAFVAWRTRRIELTILAAMAVVYLHGRLLGG